MDENKKNTCFEFCKDNINNVCMNSYVLQEKLVCIIKEKYKDKDKVSDEI